MSWAAIGTIAAIVAATAAVVQTWTAWKNHQREEVKWLSSRSKSTRSRLSANPSPDRIIDPPGIQNPHLIQKIHFNGLSLQQLT